MDTIFNPLVGGLLIGLTTTVYLLSTGKVIGISGILAQLLFSKARLLPLLFIAGLIIGGSAYGVLTEQTVAMPETRSPLLLILSGLLVGYGTRLGSGCTSGHGVCGIARLSPRSIVATLIFMTTAIITVAFLH
ncbi:YeeE/YedE family protein [Marinomonas sp. M1K-6]|uniref:YeeE/YedE family protein n=1 Tax=Marinomonas profundi TaxID=2726122 RepID=A0A847QWB2_9GAMM|nr:YeeE/YedE thiosulfate transporter family protein [Marinomonas profundi]NLQ16349.1 YeeE/YedE family protein [Marinomonas profundi]UDV03076.1 YeeE/YedE family protein [Marinomonas profundi]